MSSTTFVDGVTLTDDSWFNDVNDTVYEVLGDGSASPSSAVAAMKNLFKKSADIASATTTNLNSATGNYVDITGVVTIASFGTVNEGVWFLLQFDSSLTITHNATSMILPGATDFKTTAGDCLLVVSLGSGNWKVAGVFANFAAPYPAGIIEDYAGSTIPAGRLPCDGAAVSRTTYARLFAAIGTTWGAGDGSTTFNVPNLNGRGTIGDGTGTVVEEVTATSGNGFTVASNDTKWLTGMTVVLSNLTGFTTSASAGPTYYVSRISATNVRLATTLALAQNATPDVTISGTGTATLTHSYTARTLGQYIGKESHAMTSTELLSHLHTQTSHSHNYDKTNTAAGLLDSGTTRGGYTSTATNSVAPEIQSTGGNAAMNIMNPGAVMKKIITY